MRISFKFSRASEFDGINEPKNPLLAGMFTSSASLTMRLERIYGSRVDVEVIRLGHSTLGEDEAAALNVQAGTAAIEREVWLKAKETRLVYARTLFALQDTHDTEFIQMLTNSTEPLGRFLPRHRAAVAKSGLRIVGVDDPSLITQLGLDNAAVMHGRVFRMSITREGAPKPVEALVTEIFSTELLETSGENAKTRLA